MSVILVGGVAENLKLPLRWDPAAERFSGSAMANQMLSVALRPPWRM
jgi:hypothetical protein